MSKIKLDKKDLRILTELNRNAMISAPQLAKKVGVSRQVAEYRVNKLLSQKTIYGFYTLVDVGRLGYSSFRVHIRFKNVHEEQYRQFAKELYTEHPAFWVAFVSGSFDLIADIFARNSNEFEIIFSKILQENKDIIQSYETMVILEMDLYDYGYFLEDEQNQKKNVMHRNVDLTQIDNVDKKILYALKNTAQISYVEVGKRVGLTRNAVKNRILRLEEKKIIAGYKAFVDFRHFHKQSFKIFIKYTTANIEQEKALLGYLKTKAGVLAALKLLGRWNLDIEVHVNDIKDLQQFIMDLRSKYGIIEDYEFVQLIEDYGLDFYPDKLL